MPILHGPIVDQWYRHLDKGEPFRVVAFDRDSGTVEIQDFDGDVEELELEDWYGLEIEPIAPPEDLTGPMDDIERDDLGYSDTGAEEGEWGDRTLDQLARRAGEREDVEAELPEAETEGEESEPE